VPWQLRADTLRKELLKEEPPPPMPAAAEE
jgi:hypothetical protein